MDVISLAIEFEVLAVRCETSGLITHSDFVENFAGTIDSAQGEGGAIENRAVFIVATY